VKSTTNTEVGANMGMYARLQLKNQQPVDSTLVVFPSFYGAFEHSTFKLPLGFFEYIPAIAPHTAQPNGPPVRQVIRPGEWETVCKIVLDQYGLIIWDEDGGNYLFHSREKKKILYIWDFDGCTFAGTEPMKHAP